MQVLVADLLRSDPAVAALVASRVWPLRRPQGSEFPALTLTRISGAPGRTYKGSDGLADSRLQIDAWAKTWAEAHALARAVTEAIGGHSASTGPLRSIAKAGERDLHENEERIFRVSLDFNIWHEEA